MAVTNSGMTLYTNNDTQQNWVGSDGLDIQVYIQGTGAESWLIGKNTTETATLTLSAAMGTPKYFTFYMKSDWGSFYTSITASLSDGTSVNLFTVATGGKNAIPNITPEISGDFKSSVLQIDQGSVPAYVPNNHTVMEVIVDATSTGNIRAITNHWIDCMYYGTGRTIGGTTAGNLLFKESAQLDVTSNTYDGLSSVVSGVTFFQSDVLITTTSGNSYGETVVFSKALNTDNIYTLSVTGTADFQASSYAAETGATINLNTSGATSWQMLGGSLVGLGTTIFKAGQIVSGVVFTNRTSITHSASLFTGNTINTSGIMTVSATGACSGNTFNKSTGISSVLLADLSHAINNEFVSSGTGHAVELSSIGSGTMSWSNIDSGYAATNGSTGNESIFVNVASGTLTINVATGASTPTIRTAGATVNVVAGLVSFKFTVSPSIINYEYRIYSVTALGSLAGSVGLQGLESANVDNYTYSYSFTVNTPIAVQIIAQPNNDYVESTTFYTLGATDQNVTISLLKDINN
jgi:hypothetical protein